MRRKAEATHQVGDACGEVVPAHVLVDRVVSCATRCRIRLYAGPVGVWGVGGLELLGELLCDGRGIRSLASRSKAPSMPSAGWSFLALGDPWGPAPNRAKVVEARCTRLGSRVGRAARWSTRPVPLADTTSMPP